MILISDLWRLKAGIINPLPALYDNKLINFLAELKNRDILIASISSSPILLAKAGILDEVKFTAGFFMQMADTFEYINKKNFIHQPVVKDKNMKNNSILLNSSLAERYENEKFRKKLYFIFSMWFKLWFMSK
jgi:putative intracellular protease/amidase